MEANGKIALLSASDLAAMEVLLEEAPIATLGAVRSFVPRAIETIRVRTSQLNDSEMHRKINADHWVEAAEERDAALAEAKHFRDELGRHNVEEACCNGDGAVEYLKAENARLRSVESILRDWLHAYDLCGPDNGPSLTEDECAERARIALAGEEGAK